MEDYAVKASDDTAISPAANATEVDSTPTPSVFSEEKVTTNKCIIFLELLCFGFLVAVNLAYKQFNSCGAFVDYCKDVYTQAASNSTLTEGAQGCQEFYDMVNDNPSTAEPILPRDYCSSYNTWKLLLIGTIILFLARFLEAFNCQTRQYLLNMEPNPKYEGVVPKQVDYSNELMNSAVIINIYVECYRTESHTDKSGDTHTYNAYSFKHWYDFTPMVTLKNTTTWTPHVLQQVLLTTRDLVPNGETVYVEMDTNSRIDLEPQLAQYINDMEAYLRATNEHRAESIRTRQIISLTKKIQPDKLIPLSINGSSSWFVSLFAFWLFWSLFLTIYYRKKFEKITKTCLLSFSHFATCSNPNFQPAFAGGERHGKVPRFQKLTCKNDTPQASTNIVLELE
jgi:hypothetical protein